MRRHPTLFPQRQRGMSVLGMVIIAAFVGVTVLLALRIVPTFLEYQAVVKAVQKARTEATVPGVRASFDRSAQIDDIKSIAGNDLDVQAGPAPNSGFIVSFDYRKELPLFGPAILVLNYKGSTK